MARPLRLELSGGLYHVTSRGDGRENIYLTDADRKAWLDVMAQVCQRFNWVCHAWCQMSNHYHIVIETPEANLSQGMRQLNGVYTQHFNRTHNRVGHVFQGRYKAIMVERDSYLLELARYVVLNPLRANMVEHLEQWPWSSYAANCGQATVPAWLQVDWVLEQFGTERAQAITRYVVFVHEGVRLPSVWAKLRSQVYLGSDSFIKNMQALIDKKPNLEEIPRVQRRAISQPLSTFAEQFPKKQAIARAYLSGQHTMAAVAAYFGVHYTTVSRIVSNYERSNNSGM